jgi:hypothetical protein
LEQVFAYPEPCIRRSAKRKGKICAMVFKPGIIETSLKKGKWLRKKPAKPDQVTRQEMPGWFRVPGFRFQVLGVESLYKR